MVRIKKLIYKWLLSWISLYDIIYLIRKIMIRDELKEINLTDRNSDGKAMKGRIYLTIE